MNPPAVGDPTYRQFALQVINNFEFLNGQVGAGSEEVVNGSFELDTNDDGTPDNWDVVSYSDGNNFGLDIEVHSHGGKSFYFTSPGGAAGGGDITMGGYGVTQDERPFFLRWAHRATAATLSLKVLVLWYDAEYEPIAGTPTTEVYANNTTNENRLRYFSRYVQPPEGARFWRFKFVGIETGSGAGTVWLDHVSYRFVEPGSAVLLVAAPDSPTAAKARADILCRPRPVLNPNLSDTYSPYINEALELVAAAGGGQVLLAEGTYYIGVAGGVNTRIELQSNVMLSGHGPRTRIVPNGGQENQAGETLVYANGLTRTGLRDLFLDGSVEVDGGVFAAGRFAAQFVDCDTVVLERVVASGMNGTDVLRGALAQLDGCTRTRVRDCEFLNGRYLGLWVTGGEGHVVDGCHFEGMEHTAMYVHDTSHVAVRGCLVQACGVGTGNDPRHGAHFDTVANLTFTGNHIRGHGTNVNPPAYPLILTAVTDAVLTGNTFSDNWFGLLVDANCSGVGFFGNTFAANGKQINTSSQLTLNGNSCATKGNTFDGGAAAGYPIVVSGQGNDVEGNLYLGHVLKNGPLAQHVSNTYKTPPTAWRGYDDGTYSTTWTDLQDRITFTPGLAGAGLYAAVVSVETYVDNGGAGDIVFTGGGQVGSSHSHYTNVVAAQTVSAVILFNQAPGAIKIRARTRVNGKNIYVRRGRCVVFKVVNPDSTGWF